MLKRIAFEIKDENNSVTFYFYLLKVLPTSDLFNIIMLKNMSVKNKPSNLGLHNTN